MSWVFLYKELATNSYNNMTFPIPTDSDGTILWLTSAVSLFILFLGSILNEENLLLFLLSQLFVFQCAVHATEAYV